MSVLTTVHAGHPPILNMWKRGAPINSRNSFSRVCFNIHGALLGGERSCHILVVSNQQFVAVLIFYTRRFPEFNVTQPAVFSSMFTNHQCIAFVFPNQKFVWSRYTKALNPYFRCHASKLFSISWAILMRYSARFSRGRADQKGNAVAALLTALLTSISNPKNE